MIKIFSTLLMAIITLCSYGQSIESIVPAPLSVQKTNGSFILSASTKIQIDLQDKTPTTFLSNFLSKNLDFRTQKKGLNAKKVNYIRFTDKQTADLPAEGYRLTITPNLITIQAKKAGMFYALQTLIQLFPIQKQDHAVLPCVKIEDQPRFAYRGLMLDVSRHFFTVAQVKDLLDLMATYKLNIFHWHLTDDQGWRIEIKRYPKLTELGAYRVPRKDFYGADAPQTGEKATDGGFYTQEQIKDVVRYAAQRNIQVMPEIDVPGHSMAAIAAYPELSVTKDTATQVNPGSSFAKWFPSGGFEMYVDNTLNPTDEKVYQFLDQVFGEVASLFPYEYIHIGGDECFKGFWEKDPDVKAFMQKNAINTAHDLQVYFTKRVRKIVQSKHKKAIGWDEIDDGQPGDGVAIMNRFGEKGALSQTNRKINIVLAPGGNGLYFDYAQSKSEMEPINHGGNDPVWKTYAYQADYTKMTEADKNYILGVQGCIWTEGMNNTRKVNYMILPRMLALAETGWSSIKNKNYDRFAENAVPIHLARFDQQGINYRVPTAFNYTDTILVGHQFSFDLKPPVLGSKIYYTLDNRFPEETGHEYTQPITIKLIPNKKTILKTIVISPAGKRSVVTRTVMINPTIRRDTTPKQVSAGLSYNITQIDGITARIDTGITADLNLEKFKDLKNVNIKLQGYLLIPEDGLYELVTASKSTTIYVDGIKQFDSEKPYPRFDLADPLHLKKGYHKIRIEYQAFNGTGEPLFLKKINEESQKLGAADFFH
jgi:hexosaminidase